MVVVLNLGYDKIDVPSRSREFQTAPPDPGPLALNCNSTYLAVNSSKVSSWCPSLARAVELKLIVEPVDVAMTAKRAPELLERGVRARRALERKKEVCWLAARAARRSIEVEDIVDAVMIVCGEDRGWVNRK